MILELILYFVIAGLETLAIYLIIDICSEMKRKRKHE